MEHFHKPNPATATHQYPTRALGSVASEAVCSFSNQLTDFPWMGGGCLLPENNQSLSSSSSEDPPENSIPSPGGKQLEAPSKSKKKENRKRQARFAFMTKSETDHLEDGYRWRKYGQKPVKNTPFPRSYYRCTNRKCSVKKRVERCCQDPTVVITTYEGQHCHHTAAGVFHRGDVIGSTSHEPTFATHLFSPTTRMISHFYSPAADLSTTTVSHQHNAASTPLHPLTDDQGGLLGDILPRGIRNGSRPH